MLRKITVFIFLLMLTAASASAYIINFEAPSTIESGTVYTVAGTSTLPAGFTSIIEFYKKAQVGNNKVSELPFTIQEGGIWSVEVDTAGWQAGEYTMSIPKNSEYSFGSSSTLLKMFTVTESAEKEVQASPEVTQAQQTEVVQTTSETTYPQNTPQPTTASPGLLIFPAALIAAFLLTAGKKIL